MVSWVDGSIPGAGDGPRAIRDAVDGPQRRGLLFQLFQWSALKTSRFYGQQLRMERERERDVCFSFELPRGWVISGKEKKFLWPLYFHDLLGLKIATSIAICFTGLSCCIICILHILHIYIYKLLEGRSWESSNKYQQILMGGFPPTLAMFTTSHLGIFVLCSFRKDLGWHSRVSRHRIPSPEGNISAIRKLRWTKGRVIWQRWRERERKLMDSDELYGVLGK